MRFGCERARVRWGERWGVRGIADPAGLPLLARLPSVNGFVPTPVQNTWIRVNEAEADLWGIHASRQADRGRSRILMAYTWKAHSEK